MDNTYDSGVKIVQYTPSEKCPNIEDLIDDKKSNTLSGMILMSSVTETEKEFLLKACTRHYRFNYSKIADYYAHASIEMQKLMEELALVIIDFNDAIENGYTKLSDSIASIIKERDKQDA